VAEKAMVLACVASAELTNTESTEPTWVLNLARSSLVENEGSALKAVWLQAAGQECGGGSGGSGRIGRLKLTTGWRCVRLKH
jgi:hypothetical protein